MRISLELFKQHTRTTGFDRDDEYLLWVLDSAEAHVLGMTGFDREQWDAVGDDDFPAELRQAIMMLGATMYSFRESADTAQFHPMPGFMALIKPWQKMNGGSRTEALFTRLGITEA